MKFLLFILLQCVFTNLMTTEGYLTDKNEIQNHNLNSNRNKVSEAFNTNDYSEMPLRELSRVKLCETSCKGCCLNNLCVSEIECKFLFYSTFAVTIVALAFGLIVCSLATILIMYTLYEKCKNYRRSIIKKLKDKLKDSTARTPSIEMAANL